MNEFIIHHYADQSIFVALTRAAKDWMFKEIYQLPEREEKKKDTFIYPEGIKMSGSIVFIQKNKVESYLDKIIANGFSYRETHGTGAPYDEKDLV